MSRLSFFILLGQRLMCLVFSTKDSCVIGFLHEASYTDTFVISKLQVSFKPVKLEQLIVLGILPLGS